MDSRTFLAPGDRVGRYEVLAEIARGGMAIVYAVRLTSHHGFDKKLAMKVLLPHLLDDPGMVQMFIDEARIISRIQHPHVVQVFDFGDHRGAPFLVMEYLHGLPLARVLQSGPVEEGAVLHVLGKAAEGLHAAHGATDERGRSLDVVHRDVSPQNIHVGYDGQVKVVDFGIAAAKGRLHETRTDHIKGKLAYLAPEQIDRRSAVTRRADVWSLGVVAWQALSGEPLFRGESDADTMWNVLNREVPRLDGYAGEDVADLIERCLMREPSERPGDADELARGLLDAAAVLGWSRPSRLAELMAERFEDERRDAGARLETFEAVARELTATRAGGRSQSRAPWIALGSVALLAALGGGAYWGLVASAPPPVTPPAFPPPIEAEPTDLAPAEPEVAEAVTAPLASDAGPAGEQAAPEVEEPAPPARRRRRRRRRSPAGSGGDILRPEDVF